MKIWWLRALLAIMALLAPASAGATTIRIENRSARPVGLSTIKAPGGYDMNLRSRIEPGGGLLLRNPAGKVLMPHDAVDAAVFIFAYVDLKGNGCRFSLFPYRYNSSFSKLKPLAEPINDGVCAARTGATIGDFEFTVR